MGSFNCLWNDICTYLKDEKNSIILLLGDKYVGKTEMLRYLQKKDRNNYKFLILEKDLEIEKSFVRVCFINLLVMICTEKGRSILKVLSKLPKNFNLVDKTKVYYRLIYYLKRIHAKDSKDKVFNILYNLLKTVTINELYEMVFSVVRKNIVINYYVGCYQLYDVFDNDVKYLNKLDSKLSINFVIATRPCYHNINEYINKFSNFEYFDLVIKNINPDNFQVFQSNKFLKIPIYNKFLLENKIEYSNDIAPKVYELMLGNNYFSILENKIGFKDSNDSNLLLLVLIMAIGYLDKKQIELIFNVISRVDNISLNTLQSRYAFIWDFKDKVFSGSAWGDFVTYSRNNVQLKQQLDTFFATLFFKIFNEVNNDEILSFNELKSFVRKDYKFLVDEELSHSFQLLIAFFVNYKKHKNNQTSISLNSYNLFFVEYLNKYILSINRITLEFIETLFDDFQNINLLLTYSEEIEKHLLKGAINDELKNSMYIFIDKAICVADQWSDITLLKSSLCCLNTLIKKDYNKDSIKNRYNFKLKNISNYTMNKILLNNELDEIKNIYFGGFNMNIDVLIIIATQEEENAIVNNDNWLYIDEKQYGFYYLEENDTSFALARGIGNGRTDTSIIAGYFINEFNPKVLSMAGFAAGKLGKVNLGDTIVPYCIYDYDKGKQLGEDDFLKDISSYTIRDSWKQEIERFGENWRKSIRIEPPVSFEMQKIDFLHAADENHTIDVKHTYSNIDYPNWEILIEKMKEDRFIEIQDNKKIIILKAGLDYINQFDIVHPCGLEIKPCKTIVGVLATGSRVQEWDGIFAQLEKTYDRKTCALEMEGTAVAALAKFKEIPFIIAKGIGDFARSGKGFDNRFTEYACHSSSRFLIEFLSSDKIRSSY